jgi:hypothetical protein
MSEHSPDLQITKLDAARRQLRTAIRLWFHDGDPVSIHTLLAAAHEIIHRLYRNRGLVNLIFDSDLIVDEHRSDFARIMKAAPNFFKHANNDSDRILSFNPEINDVMPIMLIQALCDMEEPLDLEEAAYVYWQLIHEPKLFQLGGRHAAPDLVANLARVSKQNFLQACELLWRQGKLRSNLLGPRPPELKGG